MTNPTRHMEFEPYQNPPCQEVLFRSPVSDEYIPWTIIEKAPVLQSYIIEAQGKKYCRTREHVQPIHLNLPHPSKVQIPIGSNAFQDHTPWPISNNALQDHLHFPIHHHALQDHNHQSHKYLGLQRENPVLQDHQCLQDHHFPTI